MNRWQASTDLTWTRFDDGDNWVVYNLTSSNIHLVTAAAHELWALVERGPASTSEDLAEALATALRRPLDDELMAVTLETLIFMDRAGLIGPAMS